MKKNQMDKKKKKSADDELGIRVLLIEDNESDGELINVYLSSGAGSSVTWVRSLSEGLSKLHKADQFDAVLLDLGLPDSDGLSTLSALLGLNMQIPIVVLTGDINEESGIEAVRLGANDYLVKGKTNSESLVRALRFSIERMKSSKRLGAQRPASESYSLKIGNLEIDFRKQEALRVKGAKKEDIALTPSEFKLLMLLHKNLGNVVSRNQIVSEIWEKVTVRTVDRHVCSLKRKLEGAGIAIETIHGFGYRLVAR